MTSRMLVACLAAVAIAAGFGSAVSARAGEAGAKDGLERSRGVPDWVLAPPQREGFVRVVDTGKSNLLELAYPFHDPALLARAGRQSVRSECLRRLRAVLGAGADAVVEAGVSAPTVVRKGYVSLDDGSGSLGSTVVTVWVLWETPLAPILERVAEKDRDAARAALARGDEGGPAWETVRTAPAWAAAPSARPGFLTVAVVERDLRLDVAKADATLRADGMIWGRVRTRLAGAGDLKTLLDAVLAGATWRSPRARAAGEVGGRPSAWVLWDVPLDRVIERVPEKDRESMRERLTEPVPAE